MKTDIPTLEIVKNNKDGKFTYSIKFLDLESEYETIEECNYFLERSKKSQREFYWGKKL